jgi:hypothetical protein|tara:strand:+ start:203 stop:415 length:213 start_codon:yes stop_codon:yes gene_type:complete
MSKFIMAYRGTLRDYSAKEECVSAALHTLHPIEGTPDLVIYEVEECGSLTREHIIAAQKLKAEEENKKSP